MHRRFQSLQKHQTDSWTRYMLMFLRHSKIWRFIFRPKQSCCKISAKPGHRWTECADGVYRRDSLEWGLYLEMRCTPCATSTLWAQLGYQTIHAVEMLHMNIKSTHHKCVLLWETAQGGFIFTHMCKALSSPCKRPPWVRPTVVCMLLWPLWDVLLCFMVGLGVHFNKHRKAMGEINIPHVLYKVNM